MRIGETAVALDLKIVVGGEAGQGVQTAGYILAKVFTRLGYYVFADQDYESRIRGGHNFFRIRAKDSQCNSISEPIDILVALNKETIQLHSNNLAQNSVILTDGIRDPDLMQKYRVITVPMSQISNEISSNAVMANSVVLGAILGLAGVDFRILEEVLKNYYTMEPVAQANLLAARRGFDHVKDNSTVHLDFTIDSMPQVKRMLINGNEAVALGAIGAGCKFLAAYPMTPSTPIMEYISSHALEYSIAVIQPEDEIAAICMAIGASYAGARSMTVTSGSGFSLMVEGLGLAGMTETPVVIVLGQRPGPAIGLPTRTEQGDLQFAIHASQGEFPRAIFAPSTPENAFWLTIKAFNTADRYQVPVILMTDHYLASSYYTVERFDLAGIFIDRGLPLEEGEMGKLSEYKRHRSTGSGVSPRAFPMQSQALVVTDSDEHDESGHLSEDGPTRTRMVEKRLKKISGLKKDVSLPLIYGPRDAEITLVGWGSSFGPLYEAMHILRRKGLKINLLHFTELWPFPSRATINLLSGIKKTFVAENNATGQFARLFSTETGIRIDGNILKYDGRPFTADHVINALALEAL